MFWDRDEAGEEQHHVEAGGLPDADRAQRIERGAAVLQPVWPCRPAARNIPFTEAELRVQHELPDDRHRDQRRHHGQEIDGAIEAAQAGAALDQQRGAEPERHRARHHDGDIGQRVLQRDPEHPVGEHFVVVRQADPGERRRAELVVGERQRDHAGERTDQHHQHQHESRRGQRVGRIARRAGTGHPLRRAARQPPLAAWRRRQTTAISRGRSRREATEAATRLPPASKTRTASGAKP